VQAFPEFWHPEKFAADTGYTNRCIGVGKILLDGGEMSIAEVKRALEKVKAKRGMVWYDRESGTGEPPVQAIEVFKLIVDSELPISLSTKPDFSDYVDEKGRRCRETSES
jgi:hypothetical protein